MIWRARDLVFSFPRPVLIMGVLNVTPDSFSDGGKFLDTDAAVAHGLRLAAEGAEVIDVGGESTRPRALPVPEEEELRRVIPVIEQLARKTGAAISIDTMKPAVARAALEAGARIVNDVGANRQSTEMWAVVREFTAGYIAMHMQGRPATMQDHPQYNDVVAEVEVFFRQRLEALDHAGVPEEQVALDVGIGFGKTLEHNLALLANQRRFTKLGRPLVLGVSRKSFLGKLLDREVDERLSGGLACSAWAVERGVSLIRAHDVKETLAAARMTEALLARVKE